MGCISAAVFLFSIVDVLAKWLATDYPVNQIIFFRMLFGLVPAIILLGPNGFNSGALYTARPLTHLWRAATGIGAMGLFFFALPLMPLADAVAISFAKPFFLAFLAVPLLGETFDRYRIAATALGFIGVLVIVQPAGGYNGWEGPALALGSAIGFALSMITIRKLSTTESTPQIVVYYTALATLVSGLSLFSAWTTPSLSALGLFVLLGLVGGTGQLLMTAAFRRAPASVIGPFKLFGHSVGCDLRISDLGGAATVSHRHWCCHHHRERSLAPPARSQPGGLDTPTQPPFGVWTSDMIAIISEPLDVGQTSIISDTREV